MSGPRPGPTLTVGAAEYWSGAAKNSRRLAQAAGSFEGLPPQCFAPAAMRSIQASSTPETTSTAWMPSFHASSVSV